MPFALSGAFAILLAKAAALCGSATVPPDPPRDRTAVVQRDDAFVIVSATAPEPVPDPIRPANLRLSRAVHIDPTLLAARALRTPGAAR